MDRNTPAILTMMRNKLNSNLSYEDKMLWFHEKGITITVTDENLYFLKADKRGHVSKLTEVCNGVIFRGVNLLCFPGPEIQEKALSQVKEDEQFIWHPNKTLFIQRIPGRNISMYWDVQKKDWFFSDSKKAISSYHKLVRDMVYNIHAVAEPVFTYNMRYVEPEGKLYLIEMWNNKTIKRAPYNVVYDHAMRMNIKRPDIYQFEGFDKLEQSDFPVEVLDKAGKKFILREI